MKVCVLKLIPLKQRKPIAVLFFPSDIALLPNVHLVESNGVVILPAPLSPNNEHLKPDAKSSLSDRRRIFKQIIVKCVLQLLLIETTNDLLRNNDIYNTIPPAQLLRMMSVLDQSYQFARSFNEDKDLRTGLWKVGEDRTIFNASKKGH
jgi:brefeldin A-inhibited guanine nucleotide-exchange protein